MITDQGPHYRKLMSGFEKKEDADADVETEEETNKYGPLAPSPIPQLDGKTGSSDDDVTDGSSVGLDISDDLDSDSDLDTDEADALDDVGVELDPPGSGDDVSDEEASDLFDTENVVVCKYEKISRTRNKWKFILKVGSSYKVSMPVQQVCNHTFVPRRGL